MLHDPFTGVIAKLLVDPLIDGETVPEPASGPTDDGLFMQLKPAVYAPDTAQAKGECAKPSKMPLKLPAVAVTDAEEIVKFPVPLLPV
jgi:hypothetical protein